MSSIKDNWKESNLENFFVVASGDRSFPSKILKKLVLVGGRAIVLDLSFGVDVNEDSTGSYVQAVESAETEAEIECYF